MKIDEMSQSFGASALRWDHFLLAGSGDGEDGSTVEAEDMFGSPDGLWADADGRIWIQTDGTQPDGSHNQMLATDPVSGELRRFLVGPADCEVAGAAKTPDGTTMFISIQHPGDSGTPEEPTLTKDDGGVIG